MFGSTLPKMPVVRRGSMARGSPIRAFGHPVLPRSLHCTRADCCNCLSEQREDRSKDLKVQRILLSNLIEPELRGTGGFR